MKFENRIYSIYPNIWNRINKKALFNMEKIKLKIKKELISIATKYCLNNDNRSYIYKISNLKKQSIK